MQTIEGLLLNQIVEKIVFAIGGYVLSLVITGSGRIENNYLRIDMKSEGLAYNYFTHHKYDIADIKENNGLCFGFWMSTGFNEKISCGSTILSEKEIPTGLLDSLAKKSCQIFKDIPMIAVK